MQRCFRRHSLYRKYAIPLVVYRFYCMALFYYQTQRHMVKVDSMAYNKNNLTLWLLNTPTKRSDAQHIFKFAPERE